jgi:Secretion system C-terminal sorting domain
MNTKIIITTLINLSILLFSKKSIAQCPNVQPIVQPQIISLIETKNKGEFKLLVFTDDTVKRNIYMRELAISNSFDYTKVFKKYTSNPKKSIDSVLVQVPDNTKQYCFQVEAIDRTCPSRNAELRSPQEICTTPINVTSKSGNVDIEWKKSPSNFIGGNSFHSYKIERFFDIDDEILSKSFPIITKIDSLKLIDYGLKCDERYKYRVTTYSSSTKLSSLTESSSIMKIQVVSNDIPSKIPRLFTTMNHDNKSVYVQGQFNANGNKPGDIQPDKYKFYRSNSLNGTYSLQYTGFEFLKDLNVDVNKQSYCYYMTWTNLCEVESEPSEKVCTIFLKNNKGILEWTKEKSHSVTTDSYIVEQISSTDNLIIKSIEILNSDNATFDLQKIPLDYGEEKFIQIEARPQGWNVTNANTLPSTLSNIIRIYKAPPLANEQEEDISLKIFPVPTQDCFSVEFKTEKPTLLYWTLTNITGQTIQQASIDKPTSNYQTQIDIKSLPKGTYFFRMYSDEKSVVRKIVKE